MLSQWRHQDLFVGVGPLTRDLRVLMCVCVCVGGYSSGGTRTCLLG